MPRYCGVFFIIDRYFYRMKKLLYCSLSILIILSCKSKKNQPEEKEESSFFPVLSFFKSQVAHVDSSLYRIIKVVHKDSTNDTIYLKREEFREAAKDYLSIPDISSEKLKDEYTETQLFDEAMNQVVLNYMPKEPGKEITRQDVMIEPGGDGDKVKSIFINRVNSSEDSTVHKILFWQVDKRFRTVTITQMANQAEKKETIEVIWNDYARQ